MADLTKVTTGKIDPSTRGKDVPHNEWRYLLSARASYCNQQFQHDCRELLLFIDDGRANEFFGYPDEVTYWREGLCLEPEAVPFAENYLRTRQARLEAGLDGRDWREIPFGQAVALGQREIGIEGGKAGPGRGHKTARNTRRLKGDGSVERTLARLERDGHHELAAKVRAGKLSANAAAIVVGYRKASTPLERVFKLLSKLTPTERCQLRGRLDEMLKIHEHAA